MTELPQVAMRQVSSGPFRGMVVVDSTLDHFLQNEGDPDALVQHSGSLLKSSSSARSALVNPYPVSGDVVYRPRAREHNDEAAPFVRGSHRVAPHVDSSWTGLRLLLNDSVSTGYAQREHRENE